MTEIVRDGYRQLGAKFDEWRDRSVLDLGCGNGDDTRALAQHGFDLTGVDLVARTENVKVIEADFLELQLPDASYDACVSFYVFNHVPRERLPGLLASIHRWLIPRGWFMHAFGQSDTEAWTGTWIDDAPTFFSSYPSDVNSRLVREAGFEVVHDEVVTFTEPEGEVSFQWVLARST